MCILIKRIQELASTLSKIRSDVFLRKVAANDPKLQKYHQNQWTTRSTGIIYVKSFTTLVTLVLSTIWVTDTMYYMYIPAFKEHGASEKFTTEFDLMYYNTLASTPK